ncbi:Hypothetical Protein FCC1311_108552 [Hondaea fermentalgiana]|uniref:TNFR-Cys domain-containing protein n=1 Tax=Hondaea fermentalgiana TaxID=2315210 RepID=A0A2R5H0P7_9STRA|nr:Hypothetical Protein FCC1311_108552 [Hondaea fermentalgiana]|eukprot:GBG34633.1 Hypothetical Protein FCC1311_108552 [Hondaea fermentalgiana]
MRRRYAALARSVALAVALAVTALAVADGAPAPAGSLCQCHNTDKETEKGLENLACSNSSHANACRVDGDYAIRCKHLAASCSCACSTDLDLEFSETFSLTCDSVAASRCLLGWKARGNVTMYPGSLIQASTVWLRAKGRLDVMANSAINTTGLGLAFRSHARQTMTGCGGSNGGRGGLPSCSHPPDLTSPLLGDPIAPWKRWADFEGDETLPRAPSDEGYGFGGSVLSLDGISISHAPQAGRGGGRVYLESDNRITIAGVVLADGLAAQTGCLVDCGSGAGGTIVVNATDFVGSGTVNAADSSYGSFRSALSATGGNAHRDSAGAGGGGRIAIVSMKSIRRENFDIRAFGGLAVSSSNIPPSISTARFESLAAGALGRTGSSDPAPLSLSSLQRYKSLVAEAPASEHDMSAAEQWNSAFVSAALQDTSNCRGGAAGTITTLTFLENIKAFDASVQISNCPASGQCTAPDFALSSTPFLYPISGSSTIYLRTFPVYFTALQINKYAQVNASSLRFDKLPDANGDVDRSETGILMNAGRLLSVAYLQTSSLQLNSGSSFRAVSGAEVEITSGDLGLDSSSSFLFTGPIRVDVAGVFELDGTLQSQDGALGLSELSAATPVVTGLTSYFRGYASSIKFHKGSSVISDRIALLSNSSIVLSGKLRATYIPACAQIETRKICKDFSQGKLSLATSASRRDVLRSADVFYSNYSLAILVMKEVVPSNGPTSLNDSQQAMAAPAPPAPPAPTPKPLPPGSKNVTIINNIIVDLPAEITARSMLICGPTIHVQGRVSGNGQGCLADSGPGAGCTSSASAGGGGGHGGIGGPGVGCSAPGRTYDSEDFPILSGSGGGSGLSGIGGGSGGGVIMIGATMALRLEGEVSSDGSSGSGQDSKRRSAGGGGSGGSIRIDSPSICALDSSPGRITARGGYGGAGGGGGGGGGRVAINFADEFSGGELYFGPPPAPAHQEAGKASPTAAAITTKTSTTTTTKVTDPAGSWDTSCTHFGNFSIQVNVDGGLQGGEAPSLLDIDSSDESTSSQLSYRSRSGFEGTVSSPMCSLGHGGTWCALCPYGFYKDVEGPEPCQRCEHKSCIVLKTCEWLAEGSSHSDCPVLCNVGYVLPNCVTPLENLIDSMGGIVVFAIVLASLGLTLVIVFTCVCTRVEWCPGYYANMAKMLQKREQSRRGLMQHRREMGFEGLAEDGSPLEGSLLHGDEEEGGGGDNGIFVPLSRASSHLHSRSPTLRAGSNPGSLRPQAALVESDVRSHLKRIYFSGNNSTSMPWEFPVRLPPELSEAGWFDADAFAEMASEVNKLARHSTPTWFIALVLRILCYPLGYLYMKKQRQVRATKLQAFFEEYDHKCILNARARALMNSFKFGSDAKFTLGYVDVLASKPLNAAARQKRLPMLLFLAGDGSYWAPFGVDLSDVLVLAVPQIVELRSFIDEPWFQLLDELNSALRKVDTQSIGASSQPALRALGRYNADPDKLGGLRVRLGLFGTPNSARDEKSVRDRRLALLLSLDEEMAQQSFRVHARSQRRETGDSQQPGLSLRHLGDHLTDDQLSEAAHQDSGNHAEDRSTTTAPPPAKILSEQQSQIGTPGGGSYLGAMMTSEDYRAAQAAVEEFEKLERQQLEQSRLEHLASGDNASSHDGVPGSAPPTPPSQATPPLAKNQQLSGGSERIGGGASTADIGSVLESPGKPPGHHRDVDRISVASARSREDTHADLEAIADYGRSSQRDHFGRSYTQDTSSIAAESGIPWEANDLLEAARHPDARHNEYERREVLPAPGEILTRKHPEDSDLDDEEDFECMPCNMHVQHVLPTLRHRLGILQNRRPRRRNHQYFFRSFLSTLLLADALCTFFLLTTFSCVGRVHGSCNRLPLALTLSIYPLALVVAPLCGLTFVVFPLSGMGRHYAVWNALALINTFVAAALAISYRDMVSFEAGMLAALLLAIKLMQSRVVDFYIALIETDSSFRK